MDWLWIALIVLLVLALPYVYLVFKFAGAGWATGLRLGKRFSPRRGSAKEDRASDNSFCNRRD